jgi:hypothetical protein
LVGLEQLPACTGPSQATQAGRINGVVRRVHGTVFTNDGPTNHRPKAKKQDGVTGRFALIVIASEAKQSRCRRLCGDKIAAAPAGASQ